MVVMLVPRVFYWPRVWKYPEFWLPLYWEVVPITRAAIWGVEFPVETKALFFFSYELN
jgi:hypothetical protein